jgi:hypothetical protein
MLADELGPGVTHVIAPKDTSAQQASAKLQSVHVPSPVLVSTLLVEEHQHRSLGQHALGALARAPCYQHH